MILKIFLKKKFPKIKSKNIYYIRKKIIIVFLDLLSCFTDFVNHLCQSNNSNLNNYYFLILNSPGKPFTIYNPKKNLSNFEEAEIYDRVLGELERDKVIDITYDEFILLSLGYGSVIASSLSNYLIKK